MKTRQFSQNTNSKNSSSSKSNNWKTIGTAAAGGAIGSFATAMGQHEEETVSAPQESHETTSPEPPKKQQDTQENNTNTENEPIVNPIKDNPSEINNENDIPTPSPSDNTQNEDDVAEPVEPVAEIDTNDIDLPDLIEDVTNIEVVRDVNDNEMVVATAHNTTDGDFYLVDVDMDGDFDVVLDNNGNPVGDLTGERDQWITVADVQAKMDNGYIPPTEVDNFIADNNMDGQDINQDVTMVDDNSIA